MKINWHKERRYDSAKEKLAIVQSVKSKLSRVYTGEKTAKTAAARSRLRHGGTKSLALGNMQGEFGVSVFGEEFATVEAAYVATCYSQKPMGALGEKLVKIQRSIQKEERGLSAKNHWRFAERGQVETKAAFKRRQARYQEALPLRRKDWKERWHYEFMLYLVWSKVEQNRKFAERLHRIPRTWPILELVDDKNRSPDWGCKETSPGIYKGENHFGIIMMECRDALRQHRAPRIDVDELNRRGIYFFGKRLVFAPPRPYAESFATPGQLRHCRDCGRRSAAKMAASFQAKAADMGRRGGSSRSDKKAAAARENLRKALSARKAKAEERKKAALSLRLG